MLAAGRTRVHGFVVYVLIARARARFSTVCRGFKRTRVYRVHGARRTEKAGKRPYTCARRLSGQRAVAAAAAAT